MKTPNATVKPLIEALEPRLLYSATIDVVLVDGDLAGQDLLASASADADLYLVFDSAEDSVAGIIDEVASWAADNQAQIDSLTLLSHGSQGSFQFAGETVDGYSLENNSALWERLGEAMAADANVYLYGCETGSGEAGQALLDQLAEALDADVFASNDLTGQGGDWELEVASSGAGDELQQGLLMPVSASLLKSYNASLATTAEKGPTATGDDYNGWGINAHRAYVDDGIGALAIGPFGPTQDYYNFDLGLSAGATIDGIEVRLNGYADTESAFGEVSFDIALSWDGGASWTPVQGSSAYTDFWGLPVGVDETLGGATDDWGHAWTVDELSDANFRVRITMQGTMLTDALSTDFIGVTVHYTPNEAPTAIAPGDQSLSEDFADYTMDLKAVFADAETSDANLVYSVSGNTDIGVTVDGNGVATISSATPDWYGTENIVFSAEDEAGQRVDTTVAFIVSPVEDLPTSSGLSQQNLSEDFSPYDIDLKAIFDDAETADANLVYGVTGNTFVGVGIDANGVATISPTADWSGSEFLTFTAQDEAGNSVGTSVDFVVAAVEDAPTTTGIPDQVLPQGFADYTIDLNTYFDDAETSDAQLLYSVSGNANIGVAIASNGIASISSTPSWNGSETLVFRAEDEAGLTVDSVVNFTVTSNNAQPTTSGLPDQNLQEDFVSYDIDLKAIFDDSETADASLVYTVSGSANIGISIDANGIASINASADWNGTESITFSATDEGGLSVSTTADFSVAPVNDLPTAFALPTQDLVEDFASYTIDLNSIFDDLETPDTLLVYGVSANSNIGISIDSDGLATITSSPGWSGNETVVFSALDESAGGVDLAVEFIVQPLEVPPAAPPAEPPPGPSPANQPPAVPPAPIVDEPPTVSGLSSQNLEEDFATYTIDLGALFEDRETPDADLVYAVAGNSLIGVDIDAGGIATITSTPDWHGVELITFSAADASGSIAQTLVEFAVTPVNDSPTSMSLPLQELLAGFEDYVIDLGQLFADVETDSAGLTYAASTGEGLGVSITADGQAIISSVPNWSGSQTVLFSATDDGGLSARASVGFLILPAVDVQAQDFSVQRPEEQPPVLSGVPVADLTPREAAQIEIGGSAGGENLLDGNNPTELEVGDIGAYGDKQIQLFLASGANEQPGTDLSLDDFVASGDVVPGVLVLRDALTFGVDSDDQQHVNRESLSLAWLKQSAQQAGDRAVPGEDPIFEPQEILAGREWYWDQLNELGDEAREDRDSKEIMLQGMKGVGSVSLSLLAGWMLRAAAFSSSMYAAIPAWRNLDIIAVLNRQRDEEDEAESPGDEGDVEDMFS